MGIAGIFDNQATPTYHLNSDRKASIEFLVPKLSNQLLLQKDLALRLSNTKNTDSNDQIYYGHIDYTGKLGTDRAIQRIDLFQPFLRTDDHLLFMDIRAGNDSHKNLEYNLGLGFRNIAYETFINGFYTYFDSKRSPNKNVFYQITAGYELMLSNLEARVNAYIPVGKRLYTLKEKTVLANNYHPLENQTIYQRINNITYEKGFGGFDIELGGSLPFLTLLSIYATYYHFMSNGMDTIEGLKLRGSIDFNQYFALEGSADLGAKNQYAKYIGFRLTLPFGDPTNVPSILQRKMVSLPTRDIDIVSDRKEEHIVRSKQKSPGLKILILDSSPNVNTQIEGNAAIEFIPNETRQHLINRILKKSPPVSQEAIDGISISIQEALSYDNFAIRSNIKGRDEISSILLSNQVKLSLKQKGAEEKERLNNAVEGVGQLFDEAELAAKKFEQERQMNQAASKIQGLLKIRKAKAERIRLQAERDAISKEIQEFLDNYNLWHDVEVIGSQNPVDEFYAKSSENTRKYIDSFIKKKEGFNFHRDLSNHNFIKLSRNIPQKGIEYFIKELIMRDPTRKNDLNETSQRGSFERGVVVISDLTASEAEKINQYLDTLDLYKRPSTHGDLVWGYDIPSNRYIESPNEIFRHVIFSKPKKHKTKDDLNSGTTERTSKQLKSAHRYYFRIKPESYGTKNYLDSICHGASYIATRIDSQYKKAPGYYGDGDSNMQKNGNGVFVINKQDMFAWGDRDTNLY